MLPSKRPHRLDPHPTRPGLSFRFNLRRLCLGLLFKYLCLNTTRLNKPNTTRRVVTTPVPRNFWGQLRFANKAHTCLVKREQCWCTVILLTHRSAGPRTVKRHRQTRQTLRTETQYEVSYQYTPGIRRVTTTTTYIYIYTYIYMNLYGQETCSQTPQKADIKITSAQHV